MRDTGDIVKEDFGGDFGAYLRFLAGKVRAKEKVKAVKRKSALCRWRNMMARCYKSNHPQYKHYGGRGISVDPRWHDFETFFMEVGLPPKRGLSIDRINNDGNYEPGNVRWATQKEQCANRRPPSRRGS